VDALSCRPEDRPPYRGPVQRGPLTRPDFRRLFAGRSISSLGDQVMPVALAFAVLDLTGSAADLGVVLAARTVPLVVFVLLGGVWADRLPRRLVMLTSDALRAATQGATAILLLTGTAPIAELACLQAAYGTAEAFFGPASVGLVPQTVPAHQLQRANALLGMTGTVAAVLGPALAGVLVATAGPGWALAVDAGTFVLSAAFLARMRTSDGAAQNERLSTIRELRAGWHAFRGRAWLWVTVAFFTLYLGVGYAPWQVLGPAVARRSLGGAGAWAAISAALGVGALLGGLVSLRLRPRYPLRVAFTGFLVATPALIGLLGAAAPLPLLIAISLLDGAGAAFFNAVWFTALQTEVPAEELSRVSSWDYLGSLALLPLGQAAAGVIGGAIGITTTLYGAAALSLVLIASTLALPAVRNFSPHPKTAS
jgi:MFS family permease